MIKERTDTKALWEYLGNNYAQLQGLIKHADTKANIIIALIGAIVSMFFSFFISESNQLPTWQIITILGLLIFSGSFAVSVLYPRTAKPTKKFSLTYFKDAQNVDANLWAKKFLNSNQEEVITKDMIINIKAISQILDKKFSRLRMAYMLFALAILIKTIFDVIAWLPY